MTEDLIVLFAKNRNIEKINARIIQIKKNRARIA